MKFQRKLSIRTIATFGAAAALTLAAPAAFASTSPVTVNADAPDFYANTLGSPGVNFVAGTQPMDCGSATASGKLVLGSSDDGLAAGGITSTTWSNCTALGGSVQMAVTQNGTWNLNAGDTDNSTGITPVTVTGVNAHVVDTTYGGAVCDFVVTGSVDGYFRESDQVVPPEETPDPKELAQTLHITLPTGAPMAPATVAAELKLSTVTNDCLGNIAQGQSATFVGAYQVGALAAPHASLNVDITQP